MLRDPQAAKIFYEQGKPKPAGSRIVNPEYAAALRAISRGGADAFYSGPMAADIVRAVRSNARPGDLALEDLAAYRAVEREPVCGPYRRWLVCSMGPPSSGGVAVLQILGMLERTAFAAAPPHSATAVHLFSEAGRLAYADRARYLGDPDFTAVPTEKLLNGKYLERRAALIGERSLRVAPAGDTEAPGTSHFALLDTQGDAVSMTTTVENSFGSRVMARGFLLNNQLTDFDFVPGGANAVAPSKRPRSSMAPTMVFLNQGELHMVIGSPGGPAIINFVAKTLVAALDWQLDLQAAVEAPNFGSRGGATQLERGTHYEILFEDLIGKNHVLEIMPMTSGLHGFQRIPGGWRGAADPRREGVAKGE